MTDALWSAFEFDQSTQPAGILPGLGEVRAAAVKRHPHRPFGRGQELGDLSVAELEHVLEDYRDPLPRREKTAEQVDRGPLVTADDSVPGEDQRSPCPVISTSFLHLLQRAAEALRYITVERPVLGSPLGGRRAIGLSEQCSGFALLGAGARFAEEQTAEGVGVCFDHANEPGSPRRGRGRAAARASSIPRRLTPTTDGDRS